LEDGHRLLIGKCWMESDTLRVRVPWLMTDANETELPAAQKRGLIPAALALYPVDRIAGTETAFCPIDVMRETLGVGACQYLLDIEGLGSDGEITPQQTAEWIAKTVERNRQAREANEIRRRVAQARKCATDKDNRIGAYEASFRRISKLCSDSQASGKPALVESAGTIEPLLEGWIGDDMAPLGRGMRGAMLKLLVESCQDILDRIGKAEASPEMRKWIGGMRIAGESQDRILAGQRMTMRRIVQLCRDLAESHPAAAESLGKVRAEAEGALRKKPSATADKGDGK
jgi:hypothetical protein